MNLVENCDWVCCWRYCSCSLGWGGKSLFASQVADPTLPTVQPNSTPKSLLSLIRSSHLSTLPFPLSFFLSSHFPILPHPHSLSQSPLLSQPVPISTASLFLFLSLLTKSFTHLQSLFPSLILSTLFPIRPTSNPSFPLSHHTSQSIPYLNTFVPSLPHSSSLLPLYPSPLSLCHSLPNPYSPPSPTKYPFTKSSHFICSLLFLSSRLLELPTQLPPPSVSMATTGENQQHSMYTSTSTPALSVRNTWTTTRQTQPFSVHYLTDYPFDMPVSQFALSEGIYPQCLPHWQWSVVLLETSWLPLLSHNGAWGLQTASLSIIALIVLVVIKG